jgi:SAM-dependent methyltransferase
MMCRHCLQELCHTLIDLGTAPPSNAYLSRDELACAEQRFPLRVLVCKHCWLVQTEDFAEAARLFSPDYAYLSSYSTLWLRHSEQFVRSAIQRFRLESNSMVVEIAANDGYLLQYVVAQAIPCYGIEPTALAAAAARARGIEIIESFFGTALGHSLASAGRSADLIIANNVLAHVPDINDFVAGIAALLKPQGIASFEFPHLVRLVEQHQFDTIYHEHFSYLSLHAVDAVFRDTGLEIFDVEELPTHGGSLRVYAQRADTGVGKRSSAPGTLLQRERDAGVCSLAYYSGLQRIAEHTRAALRAYLVEARRNGLRVAAYGAAAKGNTLLNFAGIDSALLPYVVDRNPQKQGRFLPGSHIPIVPESHLVADRPDLVLILPWNLRQEIIGQLSYIRDWGARFLVAIPNLEEL